MAISFAMLFFLRIFEKNEMRLKDWFLSFLHLLFPRLCVVCGEPLVRGEEFLCLSCLMSFPYYRLGHEGLERQLNEIMLVEGVYALYVYNRQSPYRYLVHALKYKSRREIGWMLGRMLARRFPADVKFDTVLPVPLHKKKEAKRGFNQSRVIAEGIRQVVDVEIADGALCRVVNNPSQTKVKERSRNVENIFRLQDESLLRGKHVLLLDDVITSGSTIKSCLRELSRVPDIRVSVACVGRVGHP